MNAAANATRDHIVEEAQTLLADVGSSGFRIVALAKRANVGVPTIYYHFASREQVIAQAQLRTYFELTRPMAAYFSHMAEAVAAGDADRFRAELMGDVTATWVAGHFQEDVGVMRLLLDIWADPATRQEFRDIVDSRYRNWVDLLERAQELGWVESAPHAATGVAVFWAASVGLAILPHASDDGVTAERVAELCWGRISGAPVR